MIFLLFYFPLPKVSHCIINEKTPAQLFFNGIKGLNWQKEI